MRKSLLASVLAAALAGWAEAQLPLPVHVVPYVTAGAPGQAASELTVTNLSAHPVTVAAALFGEGDRTPWRGEMGWRQELRPDETSVVADVASRASRGARRGWLLVADATPVDCASPDRPYPALLAVSARLGSSEVPVSWLNLNVSQLPSVIAGVPEGVRGSRTGVGVANLSRTAITVRVSSVAPGGSTLGHADRRVGAEGLGVFALSELKLAAPPRGGHLEVALADDADAWNPCRVAASPPPCLDPCDPVACPQRHGLPGFPAFVAFALLPGPHYVPAVTDQVAALRYGTEHRQRHCPEASGLARLVDVFTRLALLRDPRTIHR